MPTTTTLLSLSISICWHIVMGMENVKPGRKRDPRHDTQILDATLELLAETGYEAATVDSVAARAGAARATVYRRWPTKVDLVLAAVDHLSSSDAALGDLPDTGNLRDDLMASIRVENVDAQRFRINVMSGLQGAVRTEPRLAALAGAAGAVPWIEAGRTLLQRAVDRGEYPPPKDIDVLARVIPTICIHRVAIEQQPITRLFCLALIDGVVLPAMRGSRA